MTKLLQDYLDKHGLKGRITANVIELDLTEKEARPHLDRLFDIIIAAGGIPGIDYPRRLIEIY